MKYYLALLCAAVVACHNVCAKESYSPHEFVLACSPRNDLYLTMQKCGLKPRRFDKPAAAIDAAPPFSLVLLLADNYPQKTLQISPEDYEKAAAKNISLYVEYPSFVPGVSFGSPQKTTWERFVVNKEDARNLPKGRILMAHECQFLPCNATNAELVVARVAGYDTAVYGIPSSAQPILFFLSDRVAVATTKLSGFITGRFAPTREWEALWNFILGQEKLAWRPSVEPMYGPHERLPSSSEKKAIRNMVDWYSNSGLLISAARRPAVEKLWSQQAETADRPANIILDGNGRFGVLEGFNSTIRADGSQPQRTPVRNDCQAESAMVMAMDWTVDRKRGSREIASNLLDFIYFNSDLCGGARGDPRHPSFGLIAWGSAMPAWQVANYGDDNARGMMATMLAESCLNSGRWDESLLRALLANLRTTGRLGFRGDRIDTPDLERQGWKYYHDASPVNYSPHFEAYLWACYLWAYAHTGEAEFLEKARMAIGMTMSAFPDKWRWNDNMERAHMLLCLAWLVRVEDTEEHRRWLRLIADDLIRIQHPTGAFPERFGRNGGYQIPPSNEAYGTSETPLIQENGDPVSDQLYVTGFVLLGLHEAAAVLHDPRVNAAEDKLAQYVCRIQTKSKTLPCLAGTWFRAFDFERWEAWASSGDAGWGAWSEEAGWAQAWSAGTLGLRQKKTTLWEMTSQTRIAEKLPEVRGQLSKNDGQPWR